MRPPPSNKGLSVGNCASRSRTAFDRRIRIDACVAICHRARIDLQSLGRLPQSKAMILPKFTIRLLLLLVPVIAGFSIVLKYAIDEQAWAIGVAMGLGSLVCIFLIYALAFEFAMSTTLFAGRERQEPTTPFATSEPPPQILPPPEPE